MESRGPRVFRLLGLARRAGGVAPGTDAVRRAIREGEAQLILMAGDASSVQLDKIRSTLHDRPIPQVILGDRNTLGAAGLVSAIEPCRRRSPIRDDATAFSREYPPHQGLDRTQIPKKLRGTQADR